MTSERIQDQALGRWLDILPAVGIHRDHLTGHHTPCPLCGGKDRFRFDNKQGRGTWFCSQCGGRDGSGGGGAGVDLVMKFLKVDFHKARAEIAALLPTAKVELPSASIKTAPQRLQRLWDESQRLTGDDLVSRYLKEQRGLDLAEMPSGLRYAPRVTYRHDDGARAEHPAMVARILGPDGSSTLHFTFLDEATAAKASVPQPKKLARGPFPAGGSVQLAPASDTMGIAEGVETALSAAALFGMPVWAATSSIALTRWQPPAAAKQIVVLGDADRNYAGQHAAYALAQALSVKGYEVDVEMPPLGMDWNDVATEQAKCCVRG